MSVTAVPAWPWRPLMTISSAISLTVRSDLVYVPHVVSSVQCVDLHSVYVTCSTTAELNRTGLTGHRTRPSRHSDCALSAAKQQDQWPTDRYSSVQTMCLCWSSTTLYTQSAVLFWMCNCIHLALRYSSQVVSTSWVLAAPGNWRGVENRTCKQPRLTNSKYSYHWTSLSVFYRSG